MGVTGPVLRSTGLPWDLRKTAPYCGYETFEFEVPTRDTADCYGRFLIRLDEMVQSLNIIEQVLDRLRPGPVMVADKRIAWPAQLALGGDGLGNSLGHIREIMGTSMEALIHHFKLVTEGFRVPVGQVYSAVESPRGELGSPYRQRRRHPPTGCTSAIRPSPTCSPSPRCPKVACSPMSSRPLPASIPCSAESTADRGREEGSAPDHGAHGNHPRRDA